jgi:hypothetical protein
VTIAPTAPSLGAPPEPTPDCDLVELVVVIDALDDDLMVDTEYPPPYPCVPHPVAPAFSPAFEQPESQAGQRGAPADGQLLTHGKGRRA